MNTVRYSVSTAQASLCASFLADQIYDGTGFEAPNDVVDAMTSWAGLCPNESCAHVSCAAALATVESPEATEALREALERWLLVDRDACVALLGPGLDIEQ